MGVGIALAYTNGREIIARPPLLLDRHVTDHGVGSDNGRTVHIMLFLESLLRTLFIFNEFQSLYAQCALLGYHALKLHALRLKQHLSDSFALRKDEKEQGQ